LFAGRIADDFSRRNNPMLAHPQGQEFQEKWEKEILAYLEKVKPGSTKI
jgi:hypothetical protein